MSVAQVIRFDERQLMGRVRRAPQKATPCVILQFPSPTHRALAPLTGMAADDDAFPGRGRDPG